MAKSDNEEREQRILEAAADLFVHYGYDKTTVSDIARRAGVSKGTIYLHFESKDALLEGVIIGEIMAYAEKWLELLEADPEGGTIAGLYKNSLYALSDSDFMTAMFRQDGRVLGTYLRKPDNFFRTHRDQQPHSNRYLFVKMMQDAGAIRQDINAKVIAHVMNMLAYGLVGLDEVIPKEDIPPIDDLIEGIADLMDRALTPEDGGNKEAGKAIVLQVAEMGRQQLETMRNSEEQE